MHGYRRGVVEVTLGDDLIHGKRRSWPKTRAALVALHHLLWYHVTIPMEVHDMAKAVAVSIEGPYAEQSRRDGDEFPVWPVAMVDEYGETVGKVYTCFSYSKAVALGESIARDRRLGLENDASPAY